MENQHRMIRGYRDLTQSDIDAINLVKQKGEDIGILLDHFEQKHSDELDARWLAIARTHLQQGFMALTRAIARPEGF